ncbi:hypothetical protein P7K49_018652 [Saguinus oedipus]|uniref:Uncharacterized protein n=1 Tax=Saguinus oedipus TaxID=9490 RepID=A0ABQ9V6P5_SAGOE|nr:hypothetical protein P7K49_018652 [Saguinus oedipus]
MTILMKEIATLSWKRQHPLFSDELQRDDCDTDRLPESLGGLKKLALGLALGSRFSQLLSMIRLLPLPLTALCGIELLQSPGLE